MFEEERPIYQISVTTAGAERRLSRGSLAAVAGILPFPYTCRTKVRIRVELERRLEG